ncbi:hypothetical protein [Amycolatopsis sp. 195334CR]|uniref:hypothetical protein n=1 Tax=Amycolatopsis sp. 195334CR TaxID=2814588 RepID=UPI001A8EB286|nr:hypothetical protein [Amycolatopsis sp. 195334CR]MBN6038479.1 hypothetical protein [Amycolatopsis sp. 195334CR]
MSSPVEVPARTMADKLLAQYRTKRTDDLAESLALLVSLDPERVACSLVVGELLADCAHRVRQGQEDPLGDEIFSVFVRTEPGDPVEIDAVSAGCRAALRAIVAHLNGDLFDRDLQVSFAVGGSRHDMLRVIVQCVCWVVDLEAAEPGPVELSCHLG